MAWKMVYFKESKNEVWWEHNSRLQCVQTSQVTQLTKSQVISKARTVGLSDCKTYKSQVNSKLGEVEFGDFQSSYSHKSQVNSKARTVGLSEFQTYKSQVRLNLVIFKARISTQLGLG